MATVQNKATQGAPVPGGTTPVDPKLTTVNRHIIGSPIAIITPLYPGELVQDDPDGIVYRATGPTSADWAIVEG